MANATQIEIQGTAYNVKDPTGRLLIDAENADRQTAVNSVEKNAGNMQTEIGIDNFVKKVKCNDMNYVVVENTFVPFTAKPGDKITILVSGSVLNSGVFYVKEYGQSGFTYVSSISNNTAVTYTANSLLEGIAIYDGSYSAGDMVITVSVKRANVVSDLRGYIESKGINETYVPKVTKIPVTSSNVTVQESLIEVSIPKYTKVALMVFGDAIQASSTFSVYAHYTGDEGSGYLGSISANTEKDFVCGNTFDSFKIYGQNLKEGYDLYFQYRIVKEDNELLTVSKNKIADHFYCADYDSNGKMIMNYTGQCAAIPPFPVLPSTDYVVYWSNDVQNEGTYFYVLQFDSSYNKLAMTAGVAQYEQQIKITTRSDCAYLAIKTYTATPNEWNYTIPSYIQCEEGDYQSQYKKHLVIDQEMISDLPLLPAYYNGYLSAKEDRISEVASQCLANGDMFVFITDQHWTRYNQRRSPALIQHISKKCSVPVVINGGDVDDLINPEYVNELRERCSRPIHYMMGNHEWFADEGNRMYYWADSVNSNQIGNREKHYYYVDDEQSQMRHIFLNTYYNAGSSSATIVAGFDSTQKTWFENTLASTPDGYGIVIFIHGMGSDSTTGYEIRQCADQAKTNGKDVIALFTGHYHFDAVNHTEGGIPIILTTCDKNKSWYSNNVNMEPWLDAYRPTGTVYEQAFDVVIIDKENRVIHAIRIGGKAMDNNNIWSADASGFDGEGTLEERTISY